MSSRRIWVCDRCKAEAPESEWGTPTDWASTVVTFHNLPKMYHAQKSLDLCEPCQDELVRVWDKWLNPEPPGAEAEAERRRDAAAIARRECQAEHTRFQQESYERVIAERKQAEIDRRKERIAEIAKDRGQPHQRGKWPSEREPGEDDSESRPHKPPPASSRMSSRIRYLDEAETVQWWARGKTS